MGYGRLFLGSVSYSNSTVCGNVRTGPYSHSYRPFRVVTEERRDGPLIRVPKVLLVRESVVLRSLKLSGPSSGAILYDPTSIRSWRGFPSTGSPIDVSSPPGPPPMFTVHLRSTPSPAVVSCLVFSSVQIPVQCLPGRPRDCGVSRLRGITDPLHPQRSQKTRGRPLPPVP